MNILRRDVLDIKKKMLSILFFGIKRFRKRDDSSLNFVNDSSIAGEEQSFFFLRIRY